MLHIYLISDWFDFEKDTDAECAKTAELSLGLEREYSSFPKVKCFIHDTYTELELFDLGCKRLSVFRHPYSPDPFSTNTAINHSSLAEPLFWYSDFACSVFVRNITRFSCVMVS